jgi:isocitrate/isopropylmalate dehydrogenase
MSENSAIMWQHFGEFQATRAVNPAFETVPANLTMHAPHLGGTVSTRDIGEAIAHEFSAGPESE